MKVYFAADHAGFELKNLLLEHVRTLGHEVDDCGAHTYDKDDDYPAIIASAARKLSQDIESGVESRAIVLGGSGQGEAMVANRFRGVRCALYYGKAGEQTDATGKKLDVISSTREHNDANALSLGTRFLSVDEAKKVVERWLATPFSGEARHTRRIKQIDELG
ncbi:RpiB/LacA/LacB family sugar-phosphate isomerase [Candidatus Kaiserbacteria bacterium]|nr:RpiB/LacA/LacB family sugar-phosphate isomerase [Candidatus Kaiserbacteria bacterium]